MTPTEEYIKILGNLKSGDLGLLRSHIGKTLDESVDAFDLFTAIWWPLREKNQRAPRREVAWLIAKLYAFQPLTHKRAIEYQLPWLVGRMANQSPDTKKQTYQKYDYLVQSSLETIEPALQWALLTISEKYDYLDWVHLTDTLSKWEDLTTRRQWTEQLLNLNKGEQK